MPIHTIARPGPTVRDERTVKTVGGHRNAAAPRGATEEVASAMGVAAAHGPRSLLGNPEEEAGVCACFGEGGARPGLIHDASARQYTGGPSPVSDRGGNRNDRVRKPGLSNVEAEIAGLLDRSTQELRLAWRQLHRTEPPFGVSRDLLIRTLANHLREHTYGRPSAVLYRRLQTLARASDKGAVDPGVVLKAGSTLVREWRGHTHCSRLREGI